ncbi:three-helix bundle dimerization domain-containing protein [Streptomyces sp. NPDC054840]
MAEDRLPREGGSGDSGGTSPAQRRTAARPTESEDERVLTHVTQRLVNTLPGLDPRTVRGVVDTAYAEFRFARVRTYLPVLVERRARDLLSATDTD